MKTQKFTGLIVLFFAILLLVIEGCSPDNPSDTSMGNTNANISNGGISVLLDDWIYFINYSDRGSLYKVRTDGNDETKICEDMAYFLNSDGDWIYYTNGSDSGRLYKIRSDGTGREKISDSVSQNVLVSGDWIYYIDYTDQKDTSIYGRIFRMKTDGNEKQQVNESFTSSFNLNGNWIYYLNQDDLKIYKIKTNGTGTEKVSDVTAVNFCLLENEIYYIDSTQEKNMIWKMNTDGSGLSRLTEEKVSAMNVTKDWIYYGSTLAEDIGIEFWKMKTDGTDSIKINDDEPISICVNGNRIFYISFDFTSFSMKQIFLNLDGSSRKEYLPQEETSLPESQKYSMGEEVPVEDISITVHSAYSTNLTENNEPGFDSQIFDSVTDDMLLFINATIINNGKSALDLSNRLGIKEDGDTGGYSIYWAELADTTQETLKDEPGFQLERSAYQTSLLLSPGSERQIQIFFHLSIQSYPLELTIFDPDSLNPLAAIGIMAREEYVVSDEDAREIISSRFEDYEINQTGGVGFRLYGETEDKMYYAFEIKAPDSETSEIYLVNRDSGQIFVGAYDENYPDYPAVPIRPME